MRRLSFSVRDELAGRITSGAIPPGSRLPPEPQLAEDLGVSRATLREALRSLEEDGFVTRRRGAGTFATHRPRLRNNLDVNFGVTEAIRASGMEPGTVDATVGIAPASAQEASALDIAAGRPGRHGGARANGGRAPRGVLARRDRPGAGGRGRAGAIGQRVRVRPARDGRADRDPARSGDDRADRRRPPDGSQVEDPHGLAAAVPATDRLRPERRSGPALTRVPPRRRVRVQRRPPRSGRRFR